MKKKWERGRKKATRNLVSCRRLGPRASFFLVFFSGDEVLSPGSGYSETDRLTINIHALSPPPLQTPPHATVHELRGPHGKELQAEVSRLVFFCTPERAPGAGPERARVQSLFGNGATASLAACSQRQTSFSSRAALPSLPPRLSLSLPHLFPPSPSFFPSPPAPRP